MLLVTLTCDDVHVRTYYNEQLVCTSSLNGLIDGTRITHQSPVLQIFFFFECRWTNGMDLVTASYRELNMTHSIMGNVF